jgi:hypothetical protein
MLPLTVYGVLLVAIGLLLAIFSKLLFQRYLQSLSPEDFADIYLKNRDGSYEVIPFFSGLLLSLWGVFLLFFSKGHGLLMKTASLAKRLCGFLPPAKLIGAAFLFCLPWIDVQCIYRYGDGYPGRDTVLRQSGLQLATGGYENKVPQSPFRPGDPQEKPLAQEPAPAWLVAGYGAAILLGIVAGLTLRAAGLRLAALVICSAAALGLLAAQARSGFPITAALVEQNERFRADPQFTKPDSFVKGAPELILQETWWYYGAFVLPAAAVLAAVLDWWINRSKDSSTGSGLSEVEVYK